MYNRCSFSRRPTCTVNLLFSNMTNMRMLKWIIIMKACRVKLCLHCCGCVVVEQGSGLRWDYYRTATTPPSDTSWTTSTTASDRWVRSFLTRLAEHFKEYSLLTCFWVDHPSDNGPHGEWNRHQFGVSIQRVLVDYVSSKQSSGRWWNGAVEYRHLHTRTHAHHTHTPHAHAP